VTRGGIGMFRYDVVWSGMARNVRTNFLAEFHLSGGKKVVVDFPVKALKVLFSVGVRGVLQSRMEGVHTGNVDGGSSKSG